MLNSEIGPHLQVSRPFVKMAPFLSNCRESVSRAGGRAPEPSSEILPSRLRVIGFAVVLGSVDGFTFPRSSALGGRRIEMPPMAEALRNPAEKSPAMAIRASKAERLFIGLPISANHLTATSTNLTA